MMRRSPISLEEWMYQMLLRSVGFHRFVRRVYCYVNGIKPFNQESRTINFKAGYQLTTVHKIRAFRMLFWDELRASVGLRRKLSNR
ncbi:HHR061Wp [Eremothecium sinecaudum]|uniref:HHR061Wp n=1 Tax=Eremothecium sinecaudum TaxID=45286 RepID=A0A109V0E6_9SACH|nr:HHR061Wp [Eremothecium sinecaudum]AMD22830.1 HHR061Wp [Eremothecium sinecaudum]